MIGTSVAHYKIVSKLGEGGMGEVYLATDTKLNRDVALKILPEQFAADRQRMARFEREAQVLASLNHPNVGSIYGIEDADNTKALVLELIEGPTLADRIAQGTLGLNEALRITLQIAEGLEAAHDKGIIHRDLKPANVKITPEGQVKVLDFGLAKAVDAEQASSPDLTQSPTLSMAATQAGLILGTAGYMSPEQARGKVSDRRADVWAVGAVLFEMLSGKRAFDGEDISMVLAHVLSQEPDWGALPKDLPRRVGSLLERCLRKDPRQRLQAVGDIRIAIEEYLTGPPSDSGDIDQAAASPLPAAGWRRVLPWGVSAIFLLTAIFFGLTGQQQQPSPLRKLEVPEPQALWPKIAPDGKSILFSKEGSLWIRRLDQLEARRLEGTDSAYPRAFWSPDSRYVGFLKSNQIWKVSVGEGSASIVCDYPGGFPLGGSWGEDDSIVYVTATGQYRVSATGGDPEPLLAEPQRLESPHHLPGKKGLIASNSQGDIVLVGGPEQVGIRTLLRVDGAVLRDPVFSPTGHLVFRRTGSTAGIWAIGFSLSSLQTEGEDFLVSSASGSPSISHDATLVYSPREGETGLRQLVWVDRSGQVIEKIGQPQANLRFPALSPDESRIAAIASEPGGDATDIWIHDLRGSRRRLTFENGPTQRPSWHPDGQRVVYVVTASGIKIISADGDTAAETLVEGPGFAPRFSTDQRQLVFHRPSEGNQDDIWVLDMEGDAKPVAFLQTPQDEDQGRISPDGNYMAYETRQSGRDEIFLTRFPSGQGLWQVSVDGGRREVWSRDGSELFFEGAGRQMLSVKVDTSGANPLGSNPAELFSMGPFRREFDVSSDGRFLMIQRDVAAEATAEGSQAPSIVVVENWLEEFRRP